MRIKAYTAVLGVFLVLVQGCATKVCYTPDPVTRGVVILANTGVSASWTRTADGGESFSVDTSHQNWLDKIRAATVNAVNWLGRRLDTTSASIGK